VAFPAFDIDCPHVYSLDLASLEVRLRVRFEVDLVVHLSSSRLFVGNLEAHLFALDL